MDNLLITGRVRLFKTVEGVRYLVHDNHNVITYKGREALAKVVAGITSFSHWSLHFGCGWRGMFGEPDPSLTELYYDVRNADTTIVGGGTSLIYSMYGSAAGSSTSSTAAYCYPILSKSFKGNNPGLSISTSQTFVDSRVSSVHNSMTITCKVGPFKKKTVSGFPINELGLYFNTEDLDKTLYVSQDGSTIMEKPSAVLFAYEPIYDTVFETDSDKIEVEWTISF